MPDITTTNLALIRKANKKLAEALLGLVELDHFKNPAGQRTNAKLIKKLRQALEEGAKPNCLVSPPKNIAVLHRQAHPLELALLCVNEKAFTLLLDKGAYKMGDSGPVVAWLEKTATFLCDTDDNGPFPYQSAQAALLRIGQQLSQKDFFVKNLHGEKPLVDVHVAQKDAIKVEPALQILVDASSEENIKKMRKWLRNSVWLPTLAKCEYNKSIVIMHALLTEVTNSSGDKKPAIMKRKM